MENGKDFMTSDITIFFLRHGRSSGDDEGVHEGRHDTELMETGRAQAERRASRWKEQGIKFDRIISSPLRRAHETAQIMAQILLALLKRIRTGWKWITGPSQDYLSMLPPAVIQNQTFVIPTSLFMVSEKVIGKFIAERSGL
jgi:phosphohistidine phosphatase SixA